jgi:transposase
MKKVIGMDLGDKKNVIVVFDEEGKEGVKTSISNTAAQVQKFFAQHPGAVVVIEAGTHSPWISRLLSSMGHEVCVGNPRKLRAIWDADDKSDERDARILAMMYRLEPRLLHAIQHRGEQAQADLEMIKARDALVRTRAGLVNHARGTVKAMGHRLPSCSVEAFGARAPAAIPTIMRDALSPIIETITALSQQIKELDKRIRYLCQDRYPETKYLLAVAGVGPITALAFVLTIETPDRFQKSRTVGAYLGLTPRRDQSGETDKQMHITKAGNRYLRRLLVGCAQYILGAFGPDCDLRRYGTRIAARGGKRAKKCAAVAVARKLAVKLHRLWADTAEYQPLMSERKAA